MTARKPFLLRLDPKLFDALQRWAGDELRSVNGQVEYLLRDALRRAGRSRGEGRDRGTGNGDQGGEGRGEVGDSEV